MLDSIYDPFGTPTDELSLLNFEKFTEFEFGYTNDEATESTTYLIDLS